MRNLAEYPITDQEIVKCLKEQAEQCNGEDLVGDMRAVLLMTAADIIAGRHIAKVSKDEFLAKMPVLEAYVGRLREVADAAADCIDDGRAVGGEVIFQMGGHRRIRLADALKAVSTGRA